MEQKLFAKRLVALWNKRQTRTENRGFGCSDVGFFGSRFLSEAKHRLRAPTVSNLNLNIHPFFTVLGRFPCSAKKRNLTSVVSVFHSMGRKF